MYNPKCIFLLVSYRSINRILVISFIPHQWCLFHNQFLLVNEEPYSHPLCTTLKHSWYEWNHYYQPLSIVSANLFLAFPTGLNSWMDNLVLSTIKCRGCFELTLRFNIGFRVLLLQDNVVLSGIGRETFIMWNNNITNPSVCLTGWWNNNLNVRMVSIDRSEFEAKEVSEESAKVSIKNGERRVLLLSTSFTWLFWFPRFDCFWR